MRKKCCLFLTLFLVLAILFANAQPSSCVVDGFVEDSLTGERLPGASISAIVGSKVVTTASNSFGYFSLPVRCQPPLVIATTYVGYQPRIITLDSLGKISVVIKVVPDIKAENEVVVSGRSENRISTEQLGQLKLSGSLIKRMPEFLGDNDPLKVMQTLPGVSQGMEGTSGLIVRGGSPDQNLFLLDGTPVYNPSHLGGLFSPFNGDAIKDVTLYKSNFPARFGERLSSVVDLSTRDGNMKKLAGEGSVGMLATKVLFEGPIKKDKSSFMVSARRSYWDVLAAPLLALTNTEEEKRKANVYFYDINAKFNYILSSKDRVYASFFTSNDIYRLKVNSTYNNGANDENIARLAWRNTAGSLRWNHVFSPGFFSNTTFYTSSYKISTDYYNRESDSDITAIQEGNYTSDIKDVGVKTDLEYKAGSSHLLRFGFQGSYKYFLPGSSSKRSVEGATEQITTLANHTQGSPELAVYAEDDFMISEKLNANLGLRASVFKAPSRWYHSLDPRVSVNYVLNRGLRVSASYAQMRQYIHLLANNSVSLPTDIWVPATNDIKPMLSRQVSLGINNSFANGGLDLGVEAYYKKLNGIVEYLDGQSYLSSSSQNWEQVVEAGKGSAYGIEFFLQKKKGSSTGWISYSYSKSMREFPTINSGEPFPFKYDRRHLLNLVYMVPINHRWKFSANWTFQSGAPFTLPTSTYKTISQVNPTQPDGSYYYNSAEYIRGRNEFRLLDYHRLDLGFKWSKKKRSFEKYWNFSFYNVYNRKNPMIYFFEDDSWGMGSRLKGSGFFPFIPSISYGFKF